MDSFNQSISVGDILSFVSENDVRFIRLVFCDLLGRQKNISITPDELETAFYEGVSFDASAIKGYNDITNSDLFLFPDASTLAVLPWRPQQGRVARFYCAVRYADGTPFECDTRQILINAAKKAETMGYTCKMGSECEFYLFKTDINGEPTDIPFDNGGYLDVAPLDRGENVRREICFSLQDMGLKLETSHHEQGPGQNEIDFKFSNVVESADNIFTFKSAVKAIAARNGLFASFMPKPIDTAAGNGMHINVSLSKNGTNIFKNGETEHSKVSESFIAGVLAKAKELSLFINPTANSYDRLGECEAPKYVSWSKNNRSQLVRIPAATGERVRMELRSPDSSANPYIAFAVILSAGLYGIENNLKLPQPFDKNVYMLSEKDISELELLPESLKQAVELAEKSEFAKNVLGEKAYNNFIACKQAEAKEFDECRDKKEFYRTKYFEII